MQLNKIPSERDLITFSMAADHTQLLQFGLILNLPRARVEHIMMDYQNYPTISLMMLIRWRQNGKATLYKLLKVFDACI